MKKLIAAIVLFLAPSIGLAQASYVRGVPLSSASCSVADHGVIYSISNATSDSSVASTGTVATPAVCDNGTLRVIGGSNNDYLLLTNTATVAITVTGAGLDFGVTATDDFTLTSTDFIGTFSGTTLFATPVLGISGVYERKVTNVTVADDGAGTKPAGAIPITTDFVTCTCNDATGCAMTIAEPTPTSGYGRSLTVASVGTGNCEFTDSAGVLEIGAALVVEPTSTATFAYLNAAWHNTGYKDNVP